MSELVLGLLELIAMVVEPMFGLRDPRERKAEKLKQMKLHPFDAFDKP
jgi:hypothetical protein